MKTLLLSVLFTALAGTASLLALTADPTPTPAPSPAATLPATEPEHKAAKADKAKPTKEDKDDDEDDAKASPAPAAKPADPKRAADEQAVRKLEQDWCDATANHDADFIAKVEVEDYTFTDSEGKISGKAEELAEAKEGGDKIGFRLSDVKARIYGDTAILNGVTTFDKTDADSPEVSFRWTDTFVRKPGGEWQVAASQATNVAEAAKPTEKEDE